MQLGVGVGVGIGVVFMRFSIPIPIATPTPGNRPALSLTFGFTFLQFFEEFLLRGIVAWDIFLPNVLSYFILQFSKCESPKMAYCSLS